MGQTRDLASLAGETTIFGGSAAGKLKHLQTELEPLSRRYDVVVANPPYMGSSNMNSWLSGWTKKRYKEVCKDLCTCFIKRGFSLSDDRGYEALITSDTCMYISSFEKMRREVIERTSIVCFIDTRGTNAHPDVFDANAGWVLWNHPCANIKGSYFKLNHPIPEKGQRLLEALANPHCGWFYRVDASDFEAIPGSPIAYWANEKILAHFKFDKSLSSYTEPRQGFATGDNGRFLRNWWEPSFSKSNLCGTLDRGRKWHPCNKGGSFRKWYGNNELVVNWANDGDEMKSSMGSVIRNPQYYFRKGMTWGTISSGKLSMRFSPEGFLFESKGSVCFPLNEEDLYLHLALANACTTIPFLEILCPTLDFHEGPIGKIPTVLPSADNRNATMRLVKECILLSKADWDAFESSCDFKQHPLFR